MLTHHSSETYNVAASQAAKEARTKFEAEIARGKDRAVAVIEQVETQIPVDRVVNNKALNFRVEMGVGGKADVLEGFHRNALAQAAERAGMPLVYIDKLMTKGDWGRELLAENLNELYHNGETARYLTRSVNGEVRGFLSNAYRRMHFAAHPRSLRRRGPESRRDPGRRLHVVKIEPVWDTQCQAPDGFSWEQ